MPGAAVHPVADQRHRLAQQLGEALRDWGHRVGLGELALGGPAEVRGHHDRAAAC